MTEETQRLINSLSEKVSIIQKELLKHKSENKILKDNLTEKQVELDESRVELKELEQKYNALKIAKSLGENSDNESLKKQIAAMVREIDTCIELIDE